MTMTRRAACRALLAGSLRAQAPGPSRKPNVIVILADDLGYGDISCYGAPDVRTPHIDAMAAAGMRLTDGYVSAAVCSPSRAALLTGRCQQRFGHEFNPGSAEREAQIGFGLPASEKILPQYLKPAGYTSAIIGKWHLGARPGFHPLDRGFDEFYGFLGGANDYLTSSTPGARAAGKGNAIPSKRVHPILRGRAEVAERRYLTDAFAEEAVQFIERNRRRPFFLYLALNAVHSPLHATDRYWDRFAGIKNERRRIMAAMASAMDEAAGAVLRKVRECSLERDSLIFFLSDNGSPILSGAGSNQPLNGEKCTYYEGGVRVPFVAVWPGHIPAGKVYTDPVVSRDILPTALRVAGIAPQQGVELDGVDLLPFLEGGKTHLPHDILCWRAGKGRAVRMGKWKLVEFGDGYSKLYDVSADVGEKKDVSAEFPAIRQELQQAWKNWSAKMAPPAWPARHREITVNGERLTWEL